PIADDRLPREPAQFVADGIIDGIVDAKDSGYFRRLALRTSGKVIALPAGSGKGRGMLSMEVAGMMTTSFSVWRTIVGVLANSLSRASADGPPKSSISNCSSRPLT